ncbi:MAG TPA: AMIN domain-containing protein, partial [Candidatus Acidoferrales bacterium]|nr:AMIN domain-containing protein [Candidatus Acidoferrales bacterium]
MRKQQLTMLVSLLVFGVAALAQTPSRLDRVNVVRGTDDIRVEISSHGAVTPTLKSLDSPARVVVDLPATVMATGQSRIAVGTAGVKGVRIGMDGQTPPTTRIVVDLDQACAYELTPDAAGKLVLTLHGNAVASAAQAEVKPVALNAPADQP